MWNDWLEVSSWEFRHAREPLSIVHDCDGWALVQRGPGGRTWPDRYATAAEAAQSWNLRREREKEQREVVA